MCVGGGGAFFVMVAAEGERIDGTVNRIVVSTSQPCKLERENLSVPDTVKNEEVNKFLFV